MKKKTVQTKTKEISGARKKSFTINDFRGMLQDREIDISVSTFYELYERNGDIAATIEEIAKKVWLRGVYLTDRKKKITFSDDMRDEVLSLFLNPLADDDLLSISSFKQFKIEFYKHYFIWGEVYFHSVINGLGQLEKIVLLDPRGMQKIVTTEGKIIKYNYISRGVKMQEFKPSEIFYIRRERSTRNPANGRSKLEGIVWDALTDLEAMKTNYYFFENDSVPRALITLDPEADWDDEETIEAGKRIKTDLTGSENRHKSILSTLVKDVKLLSVSNKDIEFISQRKLTTDKVCAVFGVPKTILWYTENVNYANAQEQYQKYIEGTIIPEEESLEQILNAVLNKFSTDFDKYYLEISGDDGINVFKLHEDERADVTTWIRTVDEVRETRGYKKLNASA